MHAYALRMSNAAQNSGVHADSFRGMLGLRRNLRVCAVDDTGGVDCGYGRTKMCEGWILSFCTPDGAMYTLSLRRHRDVDLIADRIRSVGLTRLESKCHRLYQ